jgi:hypothetical protein
LEKDALCHWLPTIPVNEFSPTSPTLQIPKGVLDYVLGRDEFLSLI